MNLNFLDLFSGIGGFSLGAQWAGMKWNNHLFSEVEEYPIKVYQKNFPRAVGVGDITKLNVSGLPAGRWILTGGFPCQDISLSGKGAGLKGERSGLWFEMLRVIRELRPQFILIENVGALTTRGLPEVLTGLTETGYDAEWQCIPATAVGGAHRRERIFIIAYPQGLYAQGSGSEEVLWKSRVQKQFGGSIARFRDRSDLPESRFLRSLNGVPGGMDRLKCLGNAVVPQIAELLFRRVKEILEEVNI